MTATTHNAQIHIAGPLWLIEHVCAKYCRKGLCVAITPCTFIYTGGQQTGARLGLINYPKFPKTAEEIDAEAMELARFLLAETMQKSCSVVTPMSTYYLENQ